MKNRMYNHITKLIVLFSVTMATVSCSKNDASSEGELNVKGELVSFVVDGIEDQEIVEFIPAENKVAKSFPGLGSKNPKLDIDNGELKSFDGFDAYLSIGYGNHSDILKGKILKKSALASSALQASTPLTAGIKYRILIYDSDNNYKGTIEGTSKGSSSAALDLNYNQRYKWYAYSFNSSAPMGAINTATAVIPASENAQKDLLFQSGTFTTVLGENKIVKIKFKHWASLITLKIDAKGMFGVINNLALSIPNTDGALRKSDFNLKDSSFISSSSSPLTAISINDSDWTVEDGGYTRSYKIYQANSNTIPVIPLQILNNFEVQADRPPNRVFPNAIAIDFSTPITPMNGANTIARLQLIESGIQVGSHIIARGNLYYAPDTKEYKFRSHPYQHYISDLNNELWNFGVLIPNDRLSNADFSAIHPCDSVYPIGTWKVPPSGDFYASGNVAPFDNIMRHSDFEDVSDATNYLFIRSKIVPSISNLNTLTAYGYENKIYFTMTGYRNEDGEFEVDGSRTTYYGTTHTNNHVQSSGSNHGRYVYKIRESSGSYGGSGDQYDGIWKGNNIRCMRTIGVPNT